MDNSAPAAAANDVIKDADTNSFMQDVIEASNGTPVIVDFWAPWCGPCKQLGPVLEKAVTAKKGKVKLVKINIDQNQQLAANMRIQSIPAVYVFMNGQPIDGFVGAVPESQIKQMVDQLANLNNGEGDETANIHSLMLQAENFIADGRLDHAAALYEDILHRDPDNTEAYIAQVKLLFQLGMEEEAKGRIENAPEAAKQDKNWAGLQKMLELAANKPGGEQLAQLRDKAAADPKNAEARYAYAMALYAAGSREDGVNELLEIVRTNRKWNDDQARKELVNIFEALGHADPLTIDARKRLSSLLF